MVWLLLSYLALGPHSLGIAVIEPSLKIRCSHTNTAAIVNNTMTYFEHKCPAKTRDQNDALLSAYTFSTARSPLLFSFLSACR